MGQIKDKDYFEDDLSKTDWLGEVLTDVDEDTEKLGRIKVKVFGKFDLLEKEDIPWAYPQNNFTGGSKSGGGFFSVPKKGSIVSVKFDNGNIYMPEYKCHQKISDELKEEIKGSYKNAHSLIYDTETDGGLKVYFTEEKGLIFNYKDSLINILPDNTITLKFKDKRTLHILEDMISLGQETKSAEPGVLGDKNETALKNILAELKSLTQSVFEYATSQSAVTGGVSYLSPLTSALTKLLTDATTILTKFPNINNNDIPATKSKKVSLD